jgi:hypothetical protein
MKKVQIFFYLVISLMSNMAVAQSGYCDLSDETIDWFQRGQEYYNKSNWNEEDDIRSKENAVFYLSRALKNNPYCDDILLAMTQTCIALGTYKITETRYRKDMEKYEDNQSYLEAAQNYLNKVFQYSSDEQNLRAARNLAEQIKQKKQNIATLKRIRIAKEMNRVEQLEAAPFVQWEFGTGLSYGTMGTRLCYYTAPRGYFFTAGLGTSPTAYSLGAGYSMGSYRFNGHVQAAWASHKFLEKYEKAWNASCGLNISIGEHFGIRADYGLWIKNSYQTEWSIGIFYRRSFTTTR